MSNTDGLMRPVGDGYGFGNGYGYGNGDGYGGGYGFGYSTVRSNKRRRRA